MPTSSELLYNTSPDLARTLLLQRDGCCDDFCLAPAKPGDVGLDLPVRVRGMQGYALPIKLSKEDKYKRWINFEEGWVDIPPQAFVSLPAGLRVKIPDDAWGMIKPRSSTGWKRHLLVFEGTIDSGYIGPLACLVFNPMPNSIRVHDGEKLAQLVIVPKYPLAGIRVVEELPSTVRGVTGFGSSG